MLPVVSISLRVEGRCRWTDEGSEVQRWHHECMRVRLMMYRHFLVEKLGRWRCNDKLISTCQSHGSRPKISLVLHCISMYVASVTHAQTHAHTHSHPPHAVQYLQLFPFFAVCLDHPKDISLRLPVACPSHWYIWPAAATARQQSSSVRVATSRIGQVPKQQQQKRRGASKRFFFCDRLAAC